MPTAPSGTIRASMSYDGEERQDVRIRGRPRGVEGAKIHKEEVDLFRALRQSFLTHLRFSII